MANLQPNILFFFSDQHRGDWMPYPEPVKKRLGTEKLQLNMPVIQGIMDRGVSFSCAMSPAPVCAPARACLASGKRYRNCRVYQNNVNYDPTLPSFYSMLRQNGYHVTGVGKFDLNKGTLDWGDGYHEAMQKIGFSDSLDSEGKMDAVWATLMKQPGPYGKLLQKAGCLDAYVEDMINRGHGVGPTPVPDELYADNWIGQMTREKIEKLPQNKPWFMQVNFSGPHDPWDVTREMYEKAQSKQLPDPADCPEEKLAGNRLVRKNYAVMIENIDRQIGLCLETLAVKGMLENTIIVYSADHGEMMGDHGCYGKSMPEQGSVHIPMVIDASCLGGLQKQVLHTPVELQDLAATFLDYADVAAPEDWESRSLRSVVEGREKQIRETALSELVTRGKGPIRSFGCITDGIWKLIMRPDQPDRLYRLDEDPFECRDVASQYPLEVERLQQAFDKRDVKRHPALQRYVQSFHRKEH